MKTAANTHTHTHILGFSGPGIKIVTQRHHAASYCKPHDPVTFNVWVSVTHETCDELSERGGPSARFWSRAKPLNVKPEFQAASGCFCVNVLVAWLVCRRPDPHKAGSKIRLPAKAPSFQSDDSGKLVSNLDAKKYSARIQKKSAETNCAATGHYSLAHTGPRLQTKTLNSMSPNPEALAPFTFTLKPEH